MGDLISRQAAIDTLLFGKEMLSRALDDMDVDNTEREKFSWGHGLIESNIYDIEELPSAQQWIPCSERLPEEENKSYWICTDGGYQCECRWTNVNHFWTNLTTDWHWHIMDIPQYTKVIAWMPLPEPYKGEEG